MCHWLKLIGRQLYASPFIAISGAVAHAVLIYAFPLPSLVIILVFHVCFVHYVYGSWLKCMGPINLHFPRADKRCFSHCPVPPLRDDNSTKMKSEYSLDMDHIHVSFIPFLAIYYSVIPNAMYLWISESMYLVVRDYLYRRNLLKIESCNYEAVMYMLCVNGLEALNFKRTINTEDGLLIGEFCWNDIAYMKMDASIGYISEFIVLINLKEEVMISATIDGVQVTAKKAMILLWFDTAFGTHVKVHATANWGIANTFPTTHLKWLSICTVMYNYFGFTVFPQFITKFLYTIGLTEKNYGKIGKAFQHTIRFGTPAHSNIDQLVPFSKFVRFLIPLREYFLQSFTEYQHEFAGADPEALFAGTILHSLDHCLMEENIKDPLWLDVNDLEYGAMAEITRYVRAGFVPDLPGLVFDHRYKNIKHPFYQKVYRYARSLDPWLADKMDACIMK